MTYYQTLRGQIDVKNRLNNFVLSFLVRMGLLRIMDRLPAYLPRRAKSSLSYFSNSYSLLYRTAYSSVRNEMLLKTTFGPYIYVNYKDYVEREIANGNFEREYIQYFCSIINNGDIVLDVGANIGYFALLASNKVGTNGRVYAFEPIPRNYERLLKNLKANDVKNVESYNIGLSDKNEDLVMFIPEGNAGESSLSSKNWSELRFGVKSKCETVKVNLAKFDDFFKKQGIAGAAVIKIDVEGAELKVIQGMKNYLKTNNSILIMEILPILIEQTWGSVRDLIKTLVEIGFRKIYSFGKKESLSLSEDLNVIESWIGRMGGEFVITKNV